MTTHIKIGVGVLVEHEIFNIIRELEIKIAETNNNWAGVRQPPHITIKRPFLLKDSSLSRAIIEQTAQIARSTSQFHITYDGIGTFNNGTVTYLEVANSAALNKLHRKVIDAMRALDPQSSHPSELAHDTIFHTTLALGLPSNAADSIKADVVAHAPDTLWKPTLIERIGLFLSDDDEHWNVIKEFDLHPGK